MINILLISLALVFVSPGQYAVGDGSGDSEPSTSSDNNLVVSEDNTGTGEEVANGVFMNGDQSLYSLLKVNSIGPAVACHEPLGIAYGSTSSIDHELTSTFGNQNEGMLSGPGSWKISGIGFNSWLQVEFKNLILVTGLQTQGSETDKEWVTSYNISSSPDCTTFTPVADSNGPIRFYGNFDPSTVVTNFFHDPLLARCVRIIPAQLSKPTASLRLEVLGCLVDQCSHRLSSWTITPNAVSEYHTLKFPSEKIVTSMIVRGSSNMESGFSFSYSRACERFVVDNSTVLQVYDISVGVFMDNVLPSPVRAQCLRLQAKNPDELTESIEVIAVGCDTTGNSGNTAGSTMSCGETRVHHKRRRKRVVGGRVAEQGEWPWLVSMKYQDHHPFSDLSGFKHLCGASLIHPQWILGAAHCFSDIVWPGIGNSKTWLAAIGEHNQRLDDGTETEYELEKVIKHPNFTFGDYEILWDIALIKLSKPVPISDYTNPICLDTNGDFPAGTICRIAGWGQTTIDGKGSETLYHTTIPVIVSDKCAKMYDAAPEELGIQGMVSITDKVFCAVAEFGGKDTCPGDSGGPLFCQKDGRWFQMGVVSMGFECGHKEFPGIYTRVSWFSDWIEKTIEEN